MDPIDIKQLNDLLAKMNETQTQQTSIQNQTPNQTPPAQTALNQPAM